MTSKASFEETARYWSQIYAGAPVKGGKAALDAGIKDEIAMAGLNKAHVEQFEALGFERTKVVRPLRFLPIMKLILLLD